MQQWWANFVGHRPVQAMIGQHIDNIFFKIETSLNTRVTLNKYHKHW